MLASLISTPIWAQSASPQSDQSERTPSDIVVTARRVEERLQDVPISITVFTPEQIAKRNIVEPGDLVIYTPSLSSTAIFGRDNSAYAIRGFTQANRTAASVAVYFADVVAPRSGPTAPSGDGAGPGQFFDLQNVQVLKGPQGTLFGRNTTGGAVLLVPQKPVDRFEGYVEGLYGNFNWKGLQGVINLPLGEHARLRVSGDFQDRDGLTRNLSGGPNLDDRHYFSLRASLVADLTPSLENYMIAQYSKSDNNGSGAHIIACNPAMLPLGQLYCGTPDRPFDREKADGGVHVASSSVANPFNRSTRWSVINTTKWKASDNLTIKNIAGYTQLSAEIATSIFGSPTTLPAIVNVPLPGGSVPVPTGALAGSVFSFSDVYSPPGVKNSDQYTFSDELQFQGSAGADRLTWQAGLYYERSGPLSRTGSRSSSVMGCTNIATLQCFDALGAIYTGVFNAGPPATRPGPIPVGGVGDRLGTIAFRNIGVYAQGSYSLTDRLKLTLGLRYSWDKTHATSEATLYRFIPGTSGPTPSCISPRGVLANNCHLEYDNNSKAPTWLINFDYKPNNDVLIYAKYARGYRQGSISSDAAEGYQTFKPEKADVFELGLKTTLRGAISGVFNVAAFYNEIKDQQVSAIFSAPPRSGISQADGIVNGGTSRIYGVEADATLNLFRGFTLSGGYTYLNTELTGVVQPVVRAPFTTGLVSVKPGGDLVYSPHHKFTVNASYRLPLDESIGSVTLGSTYAFTSSQIASAASPFGTLPKYGVLNFNIDWKDVAGTPVDVSLFMTNALNKDYLTYVTGLFNAIGSDAGRYGDPRAFGVKVRYRFGS
jgi:iron complex outermembrane receptor protein